MITGRYSPELDTIDYLVFSSHKTATQTITNSLKNSKLVAAHCHDLMSLNIHVGQFRDFLIRRNINKKNKLKIISTFREPISRHISSFFQVYGTRALQIKDALSQDDTILRRWAIPELQALFVKELRDRSLIGYEESLHRIFQELPIDSSFLNFDPNSNLGIVETDLAVIYLFRYDLLIRNIKGALQKIDGQDINVVNKNISSGKWYADIFAEFKKTLVIPESEIRRTYSQKNDLVQLFYKEDSYHLLEGTIDIYK